VKEATCFSKESDIEESQTKNTVKVRWDYYAKKNSKEMPTRYDVILRKIVTDRKRLFWWISL